MNSDERLMGALRSLAEEVPELMNKCEYFRRIASRGLDDTAAMNKRAVDAERERDGFRAALKALCDAVIDEWAAHHEWGRDQASDHMEIQKAHLRVIEAEARASGLLDPVKVTP